MLLYLPAVCKFCFRLESLWCDRPMNKHAARFFFHFTNSLRMLLLRSSWQSINGRFFGWAARSSWFDWMHFMLLESSMRRKYFVCSSSRRDVFFSVFTKVDLVWHFLQLKDLFKAWIVYGTCFCFLVFLLTQNSLCFRLQERWFFQ